MNKTLDLLIRLNENIRTVHLDMGGKDRYALGIKAHPIISEIKGFLASASQSADSADGEGDNACEHMSNDGHYCTHIGDVVK